MLLEVWHENETTWRACVERPFCSACGKQVATLATQVSAVFRLGAVVAHGRVEHLPLLAVPPDLLEDLRDGELDNKTVAARCACGHHWTTRVVVTTELREGVGDA